MTKIGSRDVHPEKPGTPHRAWSYTSKWSQCHGGGDTRMEKKEILRLIKLRIQILVLLEKQGISEKSFSAIEENIGKIRFLISQYRELKDG